MTLAEAGARIAVAKDVDGANPASLGGVAAGVPGVFAPATAAAVMEILAAEHVDPDGRQAVVVGRSTVVGKPAALSAAGGQRHRDRVPLPDPGPGPGVPDGRDPGRGGEAAS